MKTKVELDNKSILVTGGAGFIGANLILRLLKETTGSTIVNIDNVNDYYETSLKEYRLDLINKAAESSKSKYEFVKGSIADKALLDSVFKKYNFNIVVNLAAQVVFVDVAKNSLFRSCGFGGLVIFVWRFPNTVKVGIVCCYGNICFERIIF